MQLKATRFRLQGPGYQAHARRTTHRDRARACGAPVPFCARLARSACAAIYALRAGANAGALRTKAKACLGSDFRWVTDQPRETPCLARPRYRRIRSRRRSCPWSWSLHLSMNSYRFHTPCCVCTPYHRGASRARTLQLSATFHCVCLPSRRSRGLGTMPSFGWLEGILRHILTSALGDLPVPLKGLHLGTARLGLEDGSLVITIDRLFCIFSVVAAHGASSSAVDRPSRDSEGAAVPAPPSQQNSENAISQAEPEGPNPLLRVLERALLGLASRLCVRISNVHMRLEDTERGTAAGVTLQRLSLGGPSLVFNLRTWGRVRPRAFALPQTDLSLTIDIVGLAAYVCPIANSTLGPSVGLAATQQLAMADWKAEDWEAAMMPQIGTSELREHLLLPLSLQLTIRVALGSQALRGYQAHVELSLREPLALRVQQDQIASGVDLVNDLVAGLSDGSEDADAPSSPPTDSENAGDQPGSDSPTTPASGGGRTARLAPLMQRVALAGLSSLDPVALASHGIPMLSAVVTLSGIEVAIVGAPGDACVDLASAAGLPAAQHSARASGHRDAVSSPRLLTAVIHDVDGLTCSLVQRHGCVGPTGAPIPALSIAVTLPGAMSLSIGKDHPGSRSPALLKLTLSSLKLAIDLEAEDIELHAKVGALRLDCNLPPQPQVAAATSSTSRELCILEVLPTPQVPDLLTCKLRGVGNASPHLATAGAMMTIDLLVGHINIVASVAVIDHLMTQTIDLGRDIYEALPESLRPDLSPQPPPPPEPLPFPLPPLSPLLLRLQVPKISAHIFEVGLVRLPAESVGAHEQSWGGYLASEVVCSLEIRQTTMELLVRTPAARTSGSSRKGFPTECPAHCPPSPLLLEPFACHCV